MGAESLWSSPLGGVDRSLSKASAAHRRSQLRGPLQVQFAAPFHAANALVCWMLISPLPAMRCPRKLQAAYAILAPRQSRPRRSWSTNRTTAAEEFATLNTGLACATMAEPDL